MTDFTLPPGIRSALEFPLMQALLGRRSRRVFLGASIPDGPFAWTSRKPALPLSDLEQMLLLTSMGGNTGWHHMIYRHERYAPHLSNYAGAAGGRPFPSAAGFHTSEIFFTSDNGTFFFPTRDAPAALDYPTNAESDLETLLEIHQNRLRKLSDQRLYLPPSEPYMEGHNTWVVNRPGTLRADQNLSRVAGPSPPSPWSTGNDLCVCGMVLRCRVWPAASGLHGPWRSAPRATPGLNAETAVTIPFPPPLSREGSGPGLWI